MPTTVLALLTLERELLEWSGGELVAGAPGVGTDGHAAGSRGSGGIYCYTSPLAAASGWMSTGAAVPPDLVALALFSFAKEDGTTTGVLRWQRAARCDAIRWNKSGGAVAPRRCERTAEWREGGASRSPSLVVPGSGLQVQGGGGRERPNGRAATNLAKRRGGIGGREGGGYN